MLLSRGDPFVFISPSKPISLGFLIAATALLTIVALPQIRKKRDEAFAAEDA
jgi:TctA family transporter